MCMVDVSLLRMVEICQAADLRDIQISIAEEKNRVYRDIAKAQYVVDRNCEEQGAVYCVGTNTSGQLGVGDLRCGNK